MNRPEILARDPETLAPLTVRCSCGARVELDGGDVDCQRCGQPFNGVGQKLRRGHDSECYCPSCC